DMFEPQDHPNDFKYPGAPPTPPYDVAGWTLAYPMGVQFDRILDGFDGPFERLEDEVAPPAGVVGRAGRSGGWFLGPETNDAFVAVNRLLAAGHEVHRLTGGSVSVDRRTYGPGAFYIPNGEGVQPLLESLAAEVGLRFEGVNSRPRAEMTALRPIRIGLWDRYGGARPAGRGRWPLGRGGFGLPAGYPPGPGAGGREGKVGVPGARGGAMPGAGGGRGGGFAGRGPNPEDIPAEYRHMLGNVTVERTVPKLREFLEAGGTVITIGSSTSLARHLGLPVEDALVERTESGEVR